MKKHGFRMRHSKILASISLGVAAGILLATQFVLAPEAAASVVDTISHSGGGLASVVANVLFSLIG